MPGAETGWSGLAAWAERWSHYRAEEPVRGGLRFVFYERVSTEDWQDPVTSRARQRDQSGALEAWPAGDRAPQSASGG